MTIDKKYIDIFTGLKRNFGYANIKDGYTDPETGKLKLKQGDYGWASRPITDKDYQDHLLGVKSIGIQACDDEGMASFGAIDVDPEYKAFSPKKFLEVIKKYNLPIVPCKSKSGGLHLYVFLKEPAKATIIRNFLSTLLFTFKLDAATEIFPKQTELGTDEKGKPLNGNFINLPYYNKKERVALNLDGTSFTFEQFIQVVEVNQKTAKELEEFSLTHVKAVLQGGAKEFEDGPPCLQALSKEKLSDGRDRFLYNYMVFAKKKYPDDWEQKIIEAARDYFEYSKEWDDEKVRFKIRSWKKETKGHTCTEEPIVHHCMKAECVKRKYGINSDKNRIFPGLSGLVKINYKPDPEYTFNVALPDGVKIKPVHAKSIEWITDQRKVRNIIGIYAGFIPPRVKDVAYQEVLDVLFSTQKELDPPKGTSPEDQLFICMKEYINGPQATTYTAFKSGATLFDEEYAYFRFDPFYNFLKSKEWKIKQDRTGWMIENIEKIKGKFTRKRFPKKKKEEKSYEPLDVVCVLQSIFEEPDLDEDIVSIKSRKDII